MTLIRVVSIICIGLLLSGQAAQDANLDTAFDKDKLVIQASEHACYVFDVYLAVGRQQQMRGLMYVRHLPDFSGMLFVYSRPQLLSMWMKNTYISLDILFIRADGSIANIEKDTKPLSLDSISAIEPLHFALELNAGITERLKIDTQSRVFFPDI